METTMNQSYQITVNDSALSTKRWGLHAAFLFMGCYAVEFLAYCLIDHIFGIYNCYVEEYMPEGAFVIALLIVCVYYALREKRTKGVMQLKLQFDSNADQTQCQSQAVFGAISRYHRGAQDHGDRPDAYRKGMLPYDHQMPGQKQSGI